jgi:hypothetical protein
MQQCLVPRARFITRPHLEVNDAEISPFFVHTHHNIDHKIDLDGSILENNITNASSIEDNQVANDNIDDPQLFIDGYDTNINKSDRTFK